MGHQFVTPQRCQNYYDEKKEEDKSCLSALKRKAAEQRHCTGWQPFGFLDRTKKIKTLPTHIIPPSLQAKELTAAVSKTLILQKLLSHDFSISPSSN